jgi:hypothetical protein
MSLFPNPKMSLYLHIGPNITVVNYGVKEYPFIAIHTIADLVENSSAKKKHAVPISVFHVKPLLFSALEAS